MVHLLKASSKPVAREYKRRIVPIAATFDDFQKDQPGFKMEANDKAVVSKAKEKEAPKAAPAS